METIKDILIRRDGISAEEAEELIEGAKEDLIPYIEKGDLLGAEDLIKDYFGLEPDYLIELIECW